MANIITSIRIICSIGLLFCPTFSNYFLSLYIIAGLSDMIDGTVARKTNTVSEIGSKLDTIADILFVIVCLIKILPVLDFKIWMIIWLVIIALIKIINIICGIIIKKEFVSFHSIMNKITGVILFIFPLTINYIKLKYSFIIISIIATISAVQEFYFVITKKAINKLNNN